MKISDFNRFVAPDVSGCPSFSIELATLLTAIRFCSETLTWVEQQDPVALEDGVAQYDVDVPQGGQLVNPLRVWIPGRPQPLRAVSQATLQQQMANFPDRTAAEPEFYSAAEGGNQITVYPTPLAPTASLRIEGTYMPTMSATTIPDYLAQRHTQTLILGVTANLMMSPGKPWTNFQLGAARDALFNQACAEVHIRQLSGNVPSTTVAAPRRFI